jgi:hypothetical protein
MVLFNIRTDGSHDGYIAAVNCGLHSQPENMYLTRYGHVCSEQWWASFDRGEIPVEVLSGPVTHAGPRLEKWSDEVEDIIEFIANGKVIGYDRLGLWASVRIRIGDQISITRTTADLMTPTGPIEYLIDIRCEWIPGARIGAAAEHS